MAARLADIADESGGYAANRARAALSALYAWAIAEGLTDANPVVGTRKAVDEIARDRVLTDAELAAIWNERGRWGLWRDRPLAHPDWPAPRGSRGDDVG